MISWTCLAQHFVAHPMVIARALADSPVPPNMIVFHVCRYPLDVVFSNCRCESDGASRRGS
eukprot:13929348-Heterocapsa_arctica.AAC.1